MKIFDKISAWISMVGEWLVPILVALGAIAAAGIWIVDLYNKRKESKKNQAIIDAMKSLAEKSDYGKQLGDISGIMSGIKTKFESMSKEIQNLQTQMIAMGQIMTTIFENSSLPNETKDRLRTLSDKLEYNIDTEYLDKLVMEQNRLREELDIANRKLEEATKEEVHIVEEAENTKINYSTMVQ